MHFKGKVVLITGASSGIGAACALRFAQSHANLALVGRNMDNLMKVADSCEKISGMKALSIIADISIDDDVNKIVEETVEHHGKLDILINNAGISITAAVHDDIAAYVKIMSVNVRGTYLLTRTVIPHLKVSAGNIVNISSILSMKPLPNMMPYCMSKAAIDMFTKCIALELAPNGVRVNTVCPGPVKTQLFTRSGLTEADSEKMFDELSTTTPLKKITTVEDVAELVVFLASEKASCITGSSNVIDCGIMLGSASS